MKTSRVTQVLAVLLMVLVACTGCNRNNNNTNTSSVGDNDIVSRVEEGIDDVRSGVENEVSKIEDDLGLDMDDGVYSSDYDEPFDEDRSELLDEDEILGDDEQSEHLDESLVEESAAAAMSTDFSQIGALDAEKRGWGSGGPTDSKGRPDGSTVYQERYGEYGAYFIAPESDKIYLTFDEGYENGHTPQILDTLKEKNVKAVFFVTYPYATTEPELIQRMIDEGHIVGNHSTKHKSFPELPMEEAAEDVMQLHNYIKETFAYEMKLFRPPMGEFSQQTLGLLQSLGYQSVFWSFAYVDWEVDNQPLTIDALNTVTSKCHPGAIYLLHAVSKTNAEILGDFIDIVQGQGYQFASEWDL